MSSIRSPAIGSTSSTEIGRKRTEFRIAHIEDMLDILYPELESPLSDCSVLDMGCGGGSLSLSIAGHVKQVKGIEIDEKSIELARKVAAEHDIANAEFEVVSLFDLDEPGKYDVVLLSDVLEHVEDLSRLFLRLAELTASDGLSYHFVDLTDHTYHIFSKCGWMRGLAERRQLHHLRYSDKVFALVRKVCASSNVTICQLLLINITIPSISIKPIENYVPLRSTTNILTIGRACTNSKENSRR